MFEKRSENYVLFNNGVFPVIISDFNNESILKVNNVFTDWFRHSDPDISIISISGNRIKILEQLRNEGYCENFPMQVQHKNGKNISCLATASIALNNKNQEEILIIIHQSLENKEKTKELKTKSANLFALSENIDAIFWSVDSQLNLVNFNTKFTKYFKETYGENIRIGERIIEKQLGNEEVNWKKRYDFTLTGEKVKYTDLIEDGTFETSIIPILSEYNEVIGVSCTITDISEKINAQKNLEILYNRFNNILNSSADAAIIATDPQGVVRQFNSGASRMLGYGQDEIIGRSNLLHFFSDFFIDELKSFIHINTGKTINDRDILPFFSNNPELVKQKEWFLQDKLGRTIDIKISISSVLMDNKDFAGILIIAQDISELNRIKEELVGARIQAEEISRIKTSFLANMSHEIRTPLNGIIGMTDLLKTTDLTPIQMNYSSIIFKSAKSLMLLVNDILDYSKIEAGKLELGFTPFDLRLLMEDIKDMLLINIKERNIKFDIRIDSSVSEKLIGDPGRIKQILLNLVGNALKFTLKGSIEIEIYQVSELDKEITLHFKVIDSGIGISKDEKVRLFKSFSQVDTSTTRKYGGSGLGLAISKELVSMMKGEIGVNSNKNVGSTFWFTIKVNKDELKTDSQKTGKAVDSVDVPIKKTEQNDEVIIKVLVAEDNKINQLVAMNFLKKLGYDADLVENGKEAVQAYNKKFYDIILMDQMMPVMDGIEATKEIRKSKSELTNKDILIIALTANAMKGDREILLDSGMDDYISKPILLKDIKAVLEKKLKKSGRL
ncbi:MAG: ATP-binding protein [Spirochaetaceae bacterium]|jgi:PAS domain S-box-containing protein|nr:ATP-binding protein [Spirochaetaceae bacterium]